MGKKGWFLDEQQAAEGGWKERKKESKKETHFLDLKAHHSISYSYTLHHTLL